MGFADASRAFVRENQQAHANALLRFRLAQEAVAAAADFAARARGAGAPPAAGASSGGALVAGASADGAVVDAAPAAAGTLDTLGAGAAASAASAGALNAFVPPNALPADDPGAAALGAPAGTIFSGAECRAAVLPGLMVAPAAGGAPAAGAPAHASSQLSNGGDLRAFYKPLWPVASLPQAQASTVQPAAAFPSYEESHGPPVCAATVQRFVIGFLKAVEPLTAARLARFIPRVISIDDGRKLGKNIIGEDAKNLRVVVGDGAYVCKVWFSNTVSDADNISHLLELRKRIDDAGAEPLQACYVDCNCCNGSTVNGGCRAGMSIAKALGLLGLNLDSYHWLARWDPGVDQTSPLYKTFCRDMADALLKPNDESLAAVIAVLRLTDLTLDGMDDTLIQQMAIVEGKKRHVLICFIPKPAVLYERVMTTLNVYLARDMERVQLQRGYRALFKPNFEDVQRKQVVHILNGCLTDPVLSDGSPVPLYAHVEGKSWIGLPVLRCLRGEGFNESVFSTSNELLPGRHTGITTAHALLLPSLDARNERAWAQRQGLRLPASYHPWEHAVIDAVEESLRSERSFPFSRPARTLERFGAPKAKLDWSVEHQLIAGNAEVLRLGGTGMQHLLPPPLCLQLPTTAGAAVASAGAGAPSALSGDCSDGGGLASPPPHLSTLSLQASQASQHSLAQPFCGPGVAAAAGTADVHAEPLRSLGGDGSGVAATPSSGFSTQLSHFPAPLSRAAGTAADAGAAGESVELQLTFSGLASQLGRATSSRQPAHLQGPSWRGPGAAVAAGAAGAAQPAHLAAVRDFAHCAEDELLASLLQRFGDGGVQNEGDLMQLTNVFNARSVAIAMQLRPGEDRVIWPKSVADVRRRLAHWLVFLG